MNIYKSDSGKDITYLDYSNSATSAVGLQLPSSTADPIGLAAMMRDILHIRIIYPLLKSSPRKTWDEVMEKVLREDAELWEELAAL
jgi:hypothetical protein